MPLRRDIGDTVATVGVPARLNLVTPSASIRDWWERRRNMLRCRQAVELLTDYLEGALTADERLAFEHHLARCEACTAYLAQMRVTLDVLGHLEPPPLDDRLRHDLVALFRDVRGR